MDTHHIEPMLRDGLRETLDAEHGPHPVWVGSPAAGRVAERQGTRSPLRAIAAAAAVLVVATGAAQLLQGGLRSGGAAATPSASPALLARGDFAIVDGGYEVELEAIGQGSSVTGRMIVSEPVPQQGIDTVFTVELQCTRTTEDGVIMIGGVTTEENLVAPEGTWAAIALMPGSPAKARILSQRGGPSSEATSCLAYLDEKRPVRGGWIGLVPIEGTLELGANSAAPSETPASADPSSSGNGSLPVGRTS